MHILYAINSNGLGHATRSMPLVRALLARKDTVTIISAGRSLTFLKNEFGDRIEEYIELKDYSLSNRIFTKKHVSMRRFLMFLPLYGKEVGEEHIRFRLIASKRSFDCVVSDCRFGIYHPKVPSFLINHHFKVGLQGLYKPADLFSEFGYYLIKGNFTKILIPDFEKDSLAGHYTHDFRYLRKKDYEYLGVLSMLTQKRCKKDIDYFFSISGPEPQRTVMEKKVLGAVQSLNGTVVVTLGKPELTTVRKQGNVTIYGCLDPAAQEEIMNRAKLVITRSGYSTVMDLAELEKKALLIPTKGQPEQEYLARFHKEEGNFHCVDLDNLDVVRDLKRAQRFPGFDAPGKTKESIAKFLACIDRYKNGVRSKRK